MIEVQVPRQIIQLAFIMRHVDRRHGFGVNARPHHMRMASAFFLVQYNRPRLPAQL
jgi:hypothetical protein